MTNYLKRDMRNWNGHWIWCEDAVKKNSFCYFRKEFLVRKGEKVHIFLTADTRYRMYINGAFVRNGPVQSQPYNQYYDEQDITPWVKEGTNVLGVEVYYGGHIKDTRGGLLADVETEEGTILLSTGSEFKAKMAEAWKQDTWGQWINRFAPYQEVFDAGKEPVGWKTEGFDDSTWSNAVVIAGRNGMNTAPVEGPWSKITRRPIPDMRLSEKVPEIIKEEECLYLMNRFRSQDLSISLSQPGVPVHFSEITHINTPEGEVISVTCRMDDPYGGVYNPVLLLDFGEEVTAYLELELEGIAGQTVEIGYAERLVNGFFNNALECQFADQYTLKDGKQRFRTFHWRGFRYVRLIFKDCSEPLKIHKIKAIETRYPFEEKGSFVTGDEKLQKVFDICKKTVELCCNEAIVDTPWREQSQWMGDVAAVTLGGIYGLYGDTVLSAKFLTQSANNQLQTGLISNVTNTTADGYLGCMIDYNFWWIIAVWDYYMYTGDRELLNRIYPVVCRLMLAADDFRDEYGMLNRVSYTVFIDWAANDRRGECGPLNAIYYGTLKTFEKMAEYKGDNYMADHAREAQALIETYFSERFWNGEKGLFVDANCDDRQSQVISESGNMLPVYFGLASKEQTDNIMRRFLEDKDVKAVEACPFLGFYTLRAASVSGRTDLAMEMIQDKWYERFVKKGFTSTAEEWSQNGSYRNGAFSPFFRSLSHAWSAGPAEFLVKDLNQLKILAPGGKKVSIGLQKLPCDYTAVYPLKNGKVEIAQKNGEVSVRTEGEVTVEIYEGVSNG